MADDLSARLRKAEVELTELASQVKGIGRAQAEERCRLRGKAEGVALAASYLRDYPALDAAPPPERLLPLPLTTAEVHEVAAACAAVEPTQRGYVEVQLDLDTWAKFRAALSPDSGADPEPPCPTCGVLEGDGCQAKSGQRCGWDDSPRDDSGEPAIEEPQRVIVDFAEVEPQHSPLRTWPADPKDGTDG